MREFFGGLALATLSTLEDGSALTALAEAAGDRIASNVQENVDPAMRAGHPGAVIVWVRTLQSPISSPNSIVVVVIYILLKPSPATSTDIPLEMKCEFFARWAQLMTRTPYF